MIKEKKGIGYGIMAMILLVLVISGVLLSYTNSLAGILKKESNIEVCRLSALAQAQTKFAGQSPISLKCSRKEVKFFNNKVEIDGKKESKYEFNQLDDNSVNKVVAEELRLCWYMMGEGRVDVFRQDVVDEAVIYTSGENVCIICSEISFDSKANNKRFSGLLDYLKSTKIPKDKVKEDTYYFDYLIHSQRDRYLLWGNIPWTQYTPDGWGTTDKISDNVEENIKQYTASSSGFDTNENYIVYFLAWKPAWAQEKIGHTISAYYIGLGKPSKVAKECRRLAN
ncbi:MAG: hypothetical protein Q8R04_06955 [Nanoarchaeota archaeon]|nr:hypothetical protein [Nanoarchaeota archaeon]